jgi:predicted permease
VGLLIALVIPGYILKKRNMIPDSIVGGLVTILMYVSLPFLTFSSFMKKRYETALLANMGLTLILAAILLAAMYLISKLVFSGMKDDSAKRICVTSGFLNNCAFMGIPVLQAFFPGNAEPIMYCAVFTAVFNFLVWTLGVYSITGEKKHIRVKNGVLNPPTVALFIALPLFFLKVTLPEPVMTGVDFLGNMTTPLSMMIIGIRLGEIHLAELFNSAKVYLSSFVKLIVAPLFAFAVLKLCQLFLPLNETVAITVFAIMAMPSATSVIMFAEMFGGDSPAAAKCILLSSVLSVITIPVLMLMSGLI